MSTVLCGSASVLNLREGGQLRIAPSGEVGCVAHRMCTAMRIQEQSEELRQCLESALDGGKGRHAPVVIWAAAPREAPPVRWTHTHRATRRHGDTSGANGHSRKEGDSSSSK